MQREVSTNIRLPADLWRDAKIRAAEEGKSLKDLVLEGLRLVLGIKETKSTKKTQSLRDLFLEYSGTVETGVTDGSVNHDRYIYDEE